MNEPRGPVAALSSTCLPPAPALQRAQPWLQRLSTEIRRFPDFVFPTVPRDRQNHDSCTFFGVFDGSLSTEKTRRTNKALPHFENGQKGRNTIINKYKKLERYSEIQENRVLKNLVVFSINDVVESTKNYWQGPLPTAGGTDIIPVAIPRRIS